MQLSGKLAVSEMKLKKLRADVSLEIENLQRKHLEEIRQLNVRVFMTTNVLPCYFQNTEFLLLV